MQPPSLKGGARKDKRWSCYDPNRENREDYEDMRMPSCAMTAVLEGDMLVPEEDGAYQIIFILYLFQIQGCKFSDYYLNSYFLSVDQNSLRRYYSFPFSSILLSI